MMQDIWAKVRPTLAHLIIVIDAIRNRSAFRQLARENHLQKRGPTTIATAMPVRWYSLVKMLGSTIALRPSNLVQLHHSIGDDTIWSNVVNCAKIVFDSVKQSVPEWIAEQRAISEAELPAGLKRQRFSLIEQATGASSPDQLRKTEWERYFELRVPPQDDASLSRWWKSHKSQFPVWHQIAQDYLSVPATSAGVERMFNKSRRVLSRLRLQMSPEHAELCERGLIDW
jgi:hypothetical protein